VTFDEFVLSVSERLNDLGFVRSGEDLDGPMGSAEIRYSLDRTDVMLHSDRGIPSMTVGPRGSPSFAYQPWAEILQLDVAPDLDATAQSEFFLGRMREIDAAIESDPQIETRLRNLNWRFVKEYLGLDPNMPIPGHGSSD
jgi:hypothetical protein